MPSLHINEYYLFVALLVKLRKQLINEKVGRSKTKDKSAETAKGAEVEAEDIGASSTEKQTKKTRGRSRLTPTSKSYVLRVGHYVLNKNMYKDVTPLPTEQKDR